MSGDPYELLGVARDVSAEELHDAYRRLVKLHHPDHNGGSAESATRFQEIQDAYDRVRRQLGPDLHRADSTPPADDESVQARMADLERELHEARKTRDRLRRSSREEPGRASDEELGYITTDDSFGKILADISDELSARLSGARQHPAARRVADLIEEFDARTSRPKRS
jgi:curved DNA-binding protein CbpA